MSKFKVGDIVRIKPGERASGINPPFSTSGTGLSLSMFWPTIGAEGLVGTVVENMATENMVNHWNTVTIERDDKRYIVNESQVEKVR